MPLEKEEPKGRTYLEQLITLLKKQERSDGEIDKTNKLLEDWLAEVRHMWHDPAESKNLREDLMLYQRYKTDLDKLIVTEDTIQELGIYLKTFVPKEQQIGTLVTASSYSTNHLLITK